MQVFSQIRFAVSLSLMNNSYFANRLLSQFRMMRLPNIPFQFLVSIKNESVEIVFIKKIMQFFCQPRFFTFDI